MIVSYLVEAVVVTICYEILVKFIQAQQIVPKILMKQHEGDLLNDYTSPYHPQVIIMILPSFYKPFIAQSNLFVWSFRGKSLDCT